MHEASFLKLDITKATTLLDWSPVFTAEEAVAETIDWYRRRFEQRGSFDARSATLAQIRGFTRRQDARNHHP